MKENLFEMKILRIAARIIIGLVFIFSGVVKAIDPLGSAYKFHDYFQAFHLGFLNALSLTLAVFMCTAEFISGFSVLTGLRQKTGILGVLILLVIFTPVTFILALTNPVSDCGCFGDAIHLTNWQTFGKNVVLFALLTVSYTHLRAHETVLDLVCRLLLEKKKKTKKNKRKKKNKEQKKRKKKKKKKNNK